MRNNYVVLFAALALTLPGFAEDGTQTPDRGALEAALPSDAPINVTINPEGRVSVTLGHALPSPTPCRTPVEFGVRIVNQGFVTARLEAQLVGNPPAGV